MARTLERASWYQMIRRCNVPLDPSFRNYGFRGITVHDEWLDFENFLSDMGKRPSKEYTLDRIDPNGNYEPGNCRWATKSYQAHNRRMKKKYYGAVWRADKKKWLARIRKDGKAHCLGYFNTEKEAHEAYKKAMPIYFP